MANDDQSWGASNSDFTPAKQAESGCGFSNAKKMARLWVSVDSTVSITAFDIPTLRVVSETWIVKVYKYKWRRILGGMCVYRQWSTLQARLFTHAYIHIRVLRTHKYNKHTESQAQSKKKKAGWKSKEGDKDTLKYLCERVDAGIRIWKVVYHQSLRCN